MTLRQQLKSSRRSHKAWLYSVVFTGRASIAVVILLLLSFCVQPFHQAMAAEDDATETENSSESASTDVAIQETESIDGEVEVETPVEEINEENLTENSETSDSESGLIETEIAEEEIAAEESEDDVSDSETSTSTLTETEEETEEEGGGSDDEGSETDSATSTPDENIENDTDESADSSDDSATEDSASTTEEESSVEVPVTESVNEVQNIITDENFYQFSKKSCVPVGDGTYHCTSKETSVYDASSAVYADRGASGNMEIFLRTSRGTVEQITDNNFDDTAPHYDAESMQIVWQRLINGRYQVISYDINEALETQLTFSKTNNMEPKASAAGVVWQAWDSNDWEIMYFDGEFAEQITDNILQDVTPVIQDGYIVWSIIGGEEQEAKVYSLDSGEILTISGYEGGKIANPRFVLVYDTKFENGDVVTQGFDPETGLSKPISAQPAQDPVDLPHNDPTGEIRALIQKSSDDEDLSIDQGSGDNGNGTSTTLDLGGVKTNATSSTLDLSNPSSAEIIFDATPVSTNNKLELNSYDLVITSSSSNE